MANGKFVSYLRVSTPKQGRSGLGLEAQRSDVTNLLNGGRWALIAEVVEVESGKRADNRPKLAEALALCRVHGATLVIAKLDRLARNIHFVSGLMEAGVKFKACDMPEANELTVHIMAAMAEAEGKAISARTKAALAAAKARGTKIGGLRANSAQIGRTKGNPASVRARQKRAAARASDLMPIIDAMKADGAVSLGDLASRLNDRNIPAPRGGAWSATQVMRLLAAK
jgi:DNA invertase Pin-like site-specific DNA recombinase